VPIGIIVAQYAEVGCANRFEVVGETGMRNGEVVGRQVGGLRIGVDKRCVGVVENLGIAVVLHHDDKDVIQMGNALGNRADLRKGCARHGRSKKGREKGLFLHVE
jgi:hypothetical protein